MKHAIAETGLAVLMAVGIASAAFAAVPTTGPSSTDVVGQRKDVDEVSRPKSPSGPANSFCSPGQPVCP